MDSGKRKRVFSGIQPSGGLSLANYAGALRNFKALQYECDCVFCVVDLHAITVRQEPDVLQRNTYEALAIMLACGLDPERNIMFMQSHVPAHAEMAWILNCYTYCGELGRMTQFKEKSDRHSENVNVGLFDYPVLMAGDILLYKTDIVPVGADQKQHLELSRDLAIRFNNIYGDTLIVPEPYIPEVGARIMSLQEPEKKMSKSDENENAYILLVDPPDVIRRKIKRAVTDSDNRVVYLDEKPGVQNLMSIYSISTGMKIPDIEKEFETKGYGIFKDRVAEAVVELLGPIQDEFAHLVADRKYLESVMKAGAEKAECIAQKTLAKVYEKIGLLPRPK
ncbi:MAG: tryptophan--tRNA ligase [Bacillota bacterium]|nr:tryptophan--tRNA ligase [Bacillota bacterium]